MMKGHNRLAWAVVCCALIVAVVGGGQAAAQTEVFINEIHYDNDSTDVGEFVEVAGPAGTDLSGWGIVLYNGSNGTSYGTINLSGVISDQSNGFGTLDFARSGIQNGAPDGLALVDNTGSVVQFLSYEGSFTADGGAADGITSTNIGVSESSSTPVGESLQLKGMGTAAEDFAWGAASPESPGAVNDGQMFDDGGDPPPAPELVTIMEIQGKDHESPLEGEVVTTSGIVTVVTSNGFYIQDQNGDNDVATSDGLFIFTSNSPSVDAGDRVEVTGRVTEFLPGNDSENLTITEIAFPTDIDVISTGNKLPKPVVLGKDRKAPEAVIENDKLQKFQPNKDGIDFYESLEGMRVTLRQFMAVAPTNRFGEIYGVVNKGAGASGVNADDGITIQKGDLNPERVQVDDSLFSGESPEVQVGDLFGNVTGVVHYGFGNFEVLPESEPRVKKASKLKKEKTKLTGKHNQVTISTFNVENLDPGDGGRFDDIAEIIVKHLKSPDIIALQEVQDNSGSSNDGTVSASQTLDDLRDAILSAGGPDYDFREVAPENNQDGGQPGGNIRVAYLFNPDRISFIDRGNAGPNDATDITGTGNNVQLTLSPGRVNPTNAAFDDSRKSLAAEFAFRGKSLFVINNHFASKGGSSPLYGSVQPFIDGGKSQRKDQARVVKRFVERLLKKHKNANVVVLGDLNDFQFSQPLSILTGSGLSNLTNTLPKTERWTFIFEGNSQALDHVLVSKALTAGAKYDIVHVNAAFAEDDQASDHDPAVARIRLK